MEEIKKGNGWNEQRTREDLRVHSSWGFYLALAVVVIIAFAQHSMGNNFHIISALWMRTSNHCNQPPYTRYGCLHTTFNTLTERFNVLIVSRDAEGIRLMFYSRAHDSAITIFKIFGYTPNRMHALSMGSLNFFKAIRESTCMASAKIAPIFWGFICIRCCHKST